MRWPWKKAPSTAELTVERDGVVSPGFQVFARIEAIPKKDWDMLGKRVRDEWVKWAKEQPDAKPSWLVPWESLPEREKEVDRRIGRALANMGRCRYVTIPEHSTPGRDYRELP